MPPGLCESDCATGLGISRKNVQVFKRLQLPPVERYSADLVKSWTSQETTTAKGGIYVPRPGFFFFFTCEVLCNKSLTRAGTTLPLPFRWLDRV